jgi:hypothetical protein
MQGTRDDNDPLDLRTTGSLRLQGQAPLEIALLADLVEAIGVTYALLCFHTSRVKLALILAGQLSESTSVTRALELRRHDEMHLAQHVTGPNNPHFARWVGRVYGQPLTLTAANLHSPGFWEFAGSLNPLGQARGYLNERHERCKDKDFRNDIERQKLLAEARLTEVAVRRAELDVTRTQYEIAAQIVGADEARKLAAAALSELGTVVAAANGDRDPRVEISRRSTSRDTRSPNERD